MVSGDALLFAVSCAALLFLSAIWAEFRFRRFQKPPADFDISGKATRFASRSFVLWLTPAIFIGLISLIIWLVERLPPDQVNGDPDTTVMLSSGIIVAAQVFILSLLERWARAHS